MQQLDFYILDAIQGLKCSFLDTLMPLISALGNDGLIWIATAVVLLCIKHKRRIGISILGGLLTGLLFGNIILKPLIARRRPCWIREGVELLIQNPNDYSFPSGHTLSSFIAAFILFHFDRRLGTVALIIASLIAFSRLYLYVHFPSDVIGGIILAALVATLIICVQKRIKRD